MSLPAGLSVSQSNVFNVAVNVKLVPLFQDKDLEAYFSTFEHTAMILEWPQDKWTILLSTALKGKAQVAYANVEPVDKYDYELVIEAILKASELVPEAYRQNFRSHAKSDSQTWTEYLKDKERLFDTWTKSRNTVSLADIKNLILLEEFRNHVAKLLRLHLDDLDVTDAKQAAKRADDYTVAHKLQGNQREGQSPKSVNSTGKKEGQSDTRGYVARGNLQGQETASTDHTVKGVKWCFIHMSKTHNTQGCRLYPKVQGWKAQEIGKPVSVITRKVPSAQKEKEKAQSQSHSSGNHKLPVSLVIDRPV